VGARWWFPAWCGRFRRWRSTLPMPSPRGSNQGVGLLAVPWRRVGVWRCPIVPLELTIIVGKRNKSKLSFGSKRSSIIPTDTLNSLVEYLSYWYSMTQRSIYYFFPCYHHHDSASPRTNLQPCHLLAH
jgi:hypothetical protein